MASKWFPCFSDGAESRGVTRVGAFANFLNTIIGGGISLVSLPYAAAQAGFVQYTTFTIIVGLWSAYTCDLLVVSATRVGIGSYQSLAKHLLGEAWGYLMEVMVCVNQFGCCVSYLQTFKGVVPPVLPGLEHDQTLLTILATVLVAVPSLLASEIGSIAPLSQVALAMFLAFCVYVVVQAVRSHGGLEHMDLWPMSLSDSVNATSIIVFSVTVQYNVLPIFNGLRRPRRKRWVCVLISSFVAAVGMLYGFTLLALVARPKPGPDIVSDFRGTDAGKICAALGAMAVTLTIPLFEWEGSYSAEKLSKEAYAALAARIWGKDDARVDATPHADACTDKASWQAKVIFLSLSGLLAVLLPNVSKMISLIGAFIGVPILFIMPPLIYAQAVLATPMSGPDAGDYAPEDSYSEGEEGVAEAAVQPSQSYGACPVKKDADPGAYFNPLDVVYTRRFALFTCGAAIVVCIACCYVSIKNFVS